MAKVKLRGPILAEVKINKYHTAVVKVCVEVMGEYQSDWQCDGGFYHDEGTTDIDWGTVKPVADDEYTEVTVYKDRENTSDKKITEIVQVFDDDLVIVEYE